MSNPFQELNKIAAWWGMRPTDTGDGRGYTGLLIHAKRYNADKIEDRTFESPDLETIIQEAIAWCSETTKTAQETSKTKRVIPRS